MNPTTNGTPRPENGGLFDEVNDPEGPLTQGVRSLRWDQYDETQINVGQFARTVDDMRLVVGDALQAKGTHTDEMSGLFAFIRIGGRSGYQGVTRNPLERIGVLMQNFAASDGEVLAGIDFAQLDQEVIHNLRDATLRQKFIDRYPHMRKTFDRLAGEGVVAVRGDIVVEALIGLVRLTKPVDRVSFSNHLATLLEVE